MISIFAAQNKNPLVSLPVIEEPYLFSSWARLTEVSLSALLFFIIIIAMVRLLGKRTTGQFNNFDWIITVAVGSLAASGILLKDVATADALAAIVVLAACQYLTTVWVQRTKLGSKVVRAKPSLLVHKGRYMRDAMRKERISEEEIRTALREEGLIDIEQTNWVIMETNGKLTVIAKEDAGLDDVGTLKGVRIPAELER